MDKKPTEARVTVRYELAAAIRKQAQKAGFAVAYDHAANDQKYVTVVVSKKP